MKSLPKVSIIIAQTRTGKLYDEAISSARCQYYSDYSIITEINLDKSRTIGQCWNSGVRKAKESGAEYCLFLGDDDTLAPDHIISLVSCNLETKKINKNIIGCTSYITLYDPIYKIRQPAKMYPTGMFNTNHLLENPFDEKLKNRVDTEYYKSFKKDQVAVAYWHYGYIYRQHDGMGSGKSLEYGFKEKNEEYYNKIYNKIKHYSENYRESGYYLMWKQIADKLDITDSVIDIGCGTGQFAELLYDKGIKEYTGYDFSKVAINKARTLNLDKYKFIQKDIKKISKFPKVDVYTLIEVLEHITDDKLILSKIPKGSKILISVPTFDHESHVRYFKTKGHIKDRYAKYLKNIRISEFNKFFIVTAIMK